MCGVATSGLCCHSILQPAPAHVIKLQLQHSLHFSCAPTGISAQPHLVSLDLDQSPKLLPANVLYIDDILLTCDSITDLEAAVAALQTSLKMCGWVGQRQAARA